MPNVKTPHTFSSVTSLEALPEALHGCVVAIGNFDGVHRGHQAVLEQTMDLARSLDAPAVMMTFEPHPRTVFKPDAPVFRLTEDCEKAHLAKALGLDGVLALPFTRDFAAQSAMSFIDDILLDGLKVRHVVTGYDFHFGQNRQGTPEFLKEQAARKNFGVTIVDMKSDKTGEAVSSSRIRQLLEEGDITQANKLLGYSYFVEGEVIHGEKRGRDLGFPTANIALAENSRLRHGIYAVTMTRNNGDVVSGAASFGRRPTFDNGRPLLETYLFDFSDNLYGESVRITLHGWIRGEEKFDSIEALVDRMSVDCDEARLLLEKRIMADLDQALKS